MGIRSFFHKIKIGFLRMGGSSIPSVSSIKMYGADGEEVFTKSLERYLPSCKIKRNVIINTGDGNAEIDCLVLYENKLFAIEVKRWKGKLIETENGFIQEKVDRWTGDIHRKYQKSPFKQLNRAIYLLRKQIPVKVWINGIVYFEDEKFIGINSLSDDVWFDSVKRLTEYIECEGKISREENASRFFNKCVSADFIYSKRRYAFLYGIIGDLSLNFQCPGRTVKKIDIEKIIIEHYWSFDRLKILLTDGNERFIEIENGKISVNENGIVQEYAISKIDYIKIGR